MHVPPRRADSVAGSARHAQHTQVSYCRLRRWWLGRNRKAARSERARAGESMTNGCLAAGDWFTFIFFISTPACALLAGVHCAWRSLLSSNRCRQEKKCLSTTSATTASCQRSSQEPGRRALGSSRRRDAQQLSLACGDGGDVSSQPAFPSAAPAAAAPPASAAAAGAATIHARQARR